MFDEHFPANLGCTVKVIDEQGTVHLNSKLG
jgi:hypothetical protein